MTEDEIDEAAGALSRALIAFHWVELSSRQKKLRDAVILKVIALTVLAFDIPAVQGGEVDQREALHNLSTALTELYPSRHP